MPSGNRPLPEPILTQFSIAIYGVTRHQYVKCPVMLQPLFNCPSFLVMTMCTRKDIKNNAWVTVNNDFWVTSEAICQWFSRVTKSRVKIIGKNRITSDPNIVIHGNACIILFLTRYFMSWNTHSAKNHHRSLISQLSPRTAFSDFALWRHYSWSVTSREPEILALWRHIRRLFLHAQIGAKAIFTSE